MLPTLAVAFLLAAFANVKASDNLDARDAPLATVITSCTQANAIAITFDDGPYKWMPNITKMFNDVGGHCTFFVNGLNWDCIYEQNNINALKEAFSSGHQIGGHTWSHPDLTNTTMNATTIDSEISKDLYAISNITGAMPAFCRPPYGNYNDLVRQVAAARGQTLVNWDFDSGDSTGSTAQQSKQMYDDWLSKNPTGSSLLPINHETNNGTVFDVLPHIISIFKNAGYKFVTVAECVGMAPYLSTGPAGKQNFNWHC